MELACSVNQDASNPGSIQGASGTFTAGAPQIGHGNTFTVAS